MSILWKKLLTPISMSCFRRIIGLIVDPAVTLGVVGDMEILHKTKRFTTRFL